jgi:adenylate cyclase
MNATSHPITVLLVDDQPIIGEAVKRLLAPETDIRFHFCSDPTQALAQALALSPTVILQDLVMPGIDGLTLVSDLRAEPRTRDVPLIVLSTREEPATKVEAFARGANDYLVKLPHRLELVARIRYHSAAYISMLQRNEAYAALVESQKALERRNRFIREAFGRYLSDEVVESLLETPDGLKLGGERREVTILMADLRGFTPLAERLAPEQVVALLNTFLETMTEVIATYGGTIDEIMGDALLVIFGAPVARADHAQRAVACAVAMQLAMVGVNERNAAAGLPRVELGIGVNTGEVVAGNIGSSRRAKYGIVGSPINLTSRIESCTVGGQILVSDDTLTRAGRDLVRVEARIDVELKGVRGAITLHDVGGIGGEHRLELPPRAAALSPLATPIPVRVTLIEGKHAASATLDARIVALSEREALLETPHPIPPLSDVRFCLLDEAGGERLSSSYGKIVAGRPVEDATALLRFTSVPADVAAALAERVAEARA